MPSRNTTTMTPKRSTFGRLLRRKRMDGSYLPGYYVRLRIGQKEVTRWAGPDRRTAAEFLAVLLRSSSREHLLGEKTVPEITFTGFKKQLLEHFEAHHAATTLEGERGRVERIAAHFGTRPLCAITAGEVQDFLTGLRAERNLRDGEQVVTNPPASPATRNRYASTIAEAFRLAVDKGYATSNPTVGMKRAREPIHPVPYITDADIDRLLAAASDERFRSILRILADVGLRRSEATRLEWRDLDLARGVVLVRKSKTGRPREVGLTELARAAFEAMRGGRPTGSTGTREVVWPEFQGKSIGAIEARFRRLRVRAGFPSMRLHDLRHAFCSRFAQQGVPIPTIAELAGHSSIVTTMRYARHLPANAGRDAIKRLDAARQPPSPPKAPGDLEGDVGADEGASS